MVCYDFAGVPNRGGVLSRRGRRVGLTLELPLGVQQMDKDGIVLRWSSPGRPIQGEIKRVTGR